MPPQTSTTSSQYESAYAGIGSRQTPPQLLELMTRAATALASQGWTLRTGMAPGADQAFYRGAREHGPVELYLPWPGFETDARPSTVEAGSEFRARAAFGRRLPDRSALSPGVVAAIQRSTPLARTKLSPDPRTRPEHPGSLRRVLDTGREPRRSRTAGRRNRAGAANRRPPRHPGLQPRPGRSPQPPTGRTRGPQLKRSGSHFCSSCLWTTRAACRGGPT